METAEKPKKNGLGSGCLPVIGIVFAIGIAGEMFSKHDPPKPPSLAEEAEQKRANGDAASVVVGERAIATMLKDPGSAHFEDAFGRVKNGLHVACGHVNAKNSFGALTGASPWVVVVEKNVAILQGLGDDNRFARIWNTYCTGPADTEKPGPKEFLGVAFGSRPPPTLRPYNGARQVWMFVGAKPASYLGVPITDAYYDADHGHIFAGEATAKGKASFDAINAALFAKFGLPTSSTTAGNHLTEWDWGRRGGLIQLTYDDVHGTALVHVEKQE